MSDTWTEPGRYVSELGVIRLVWPPEGRFAELWERVTAAFDADERNDVLHLLRREHEAWVDDLIGKRAQG